MRKDIQINEAIKGIERLGKLESEDFLNEQVHPLEIINSLSKGNNYLEDSCISVSIGKENVFYQLWRDEQTYHDGSHHPIGNVSVSRRVWDVLHPFYESIGCKVIEKSGED